MPGEMQLIQLARILRVDVSTLTSDSVRLAIGSRATDLGDAFFREAADNDDVTGVESALGYLESRLADFGALIPPGPADVIRATFREHLCAWTREPERLAGGG